MKSLQYLNKYLLKYKLRLILGIFFVAISNIFTMLPPQVVKIAFDTVEVSLVEAGVEARENGESEGIDNGKDFFDLGFLDQYTANFNLGELILFFGLLILLLALLEGVFTFFTRQTLIVMSRLIEYDLKNEVYKHYQELSMRFYKVNNTGDIMNRISEDVTRVRMYLGPGIMYSINLVARFAFVVPIMLYIDVELTLYSLAPLPILSILIYYISNKINTKSEVVQRHLSALSTYSQESFSGIRIIKSFVKEKYMNDKLQEEADAYKGKNLDLVRLEAFFFPTMMMLIGLSTILTIYIGGLKVVNGEMSIGVIAAFIIYVNKLTWPVTAIGWVTSLVQRAEASQKRINEFLKTTPEIQNQSSIESEIKGKISFKQVSFTYPESGVQALKEIDFTVNPGETLAIIGRTGSGKSTIADLVCRLFEATEGKVMIDDQAIDQLNLNSLRSNIGYVPQEVFLFSDSIRNNISFGITDENVADERIHDAASKAAIHQSISKFPNGYETELGERGITLSGGQKQRISIARAIIDRPNILIFDDCLSAVDTETEEKILSALKEIMVNKTALIISHRISSVLHADQILVLEEGQIVERGNHESLLEAKGLYFDTYQKQLLEDQEAAA